MTKYLVCVFTVTVLLGGVTANMLNCKLVEMSPVAPHNIILKEPDEVCQNTEENFRLVLKEIKSCVGFDFDIRRLKTLNEEFCNPNSDFRQKVERQRNCLSSHIDETLNCSSIGIKYSYLIPDALNSTNVEKSVNILCQSSAVEMTRCYSEMVGGPCGKEGLEVYGRIAEISEPMLKWSCLYAARFEADGVLPDDFEKTFVYSSTVDSGSYPNSAVTVHSSTYIMLIGLIFILNW